MRVLPWRGTVKLSRICPFCGRILLDNRLIINDLAVAAGGENAAKLLNLTVPSQVLTQFIHTLSPGSPPHEIAAAPFTLARSRLHRALRAPFIER